MVDALTDPDLMEIGKAAAELPLITGGSGVALGLPANFGKVAKPAPWSGQAGKCVALSGSCSNATRGQVALHAKTNPSYEIIAADVIEGRLAVGDVVDWAMAAGEPRVQRASRDVVRYAVAEQKAQAVDYEEHRR